LAIGSPRQRDTFAALILGVVVANEFGFQFVDETLVLQIPDVDATSVGNAEPISVGGEAECVDATGLLLVVEGVKVFALVQVPEHGETVLASGCAQGTVGRNGDGVQVPLMPSVVGLELAVSEVPDLDDAIPSTGNDDGVGVVGRETHA